MYLYLNVKNCINTIRGGPYKSHKKLVGSFIGTKYNIISVIVHTGAHIYIAMYVSSVQT